MCKNEIAYKALPESLTNEEGRKATVLRMNVLEQDFDVLVNVRSSIFDIHTKLKFFETKTSQ